MAIAASVDGGLGRLLDEERDPVVGVELDDSVAGGELEIAAVVDGDGARVLAGAPEPHVVGEPEVEEVVAGHDEQVVVDPGPVEHVLQVADRPEPVLVGARAVVVDDDAVRRRPRPELGRRSGCS